MYEVLHMLYNLYQDYVSLVNPTHMESDQRVTQVLSWYIWPIHLKWIVKPEIHFSQSTPRLK